MSCFIPMTVTWPRDALWAKDATPMAGKQFVDLTQDDAGAEAHEIPEDHVVAAETAVHHDGDGVLRFGTAHEVKGSSYYITVPDGYTPILQFMKPPA